MEDFSNARKIHVEGDVQPHALQSEWMESSRTAGARLMAELRNDARDGHARANDAADKLEFDYVPVGRISVLSSITLPDGGKVTRVTEPLPGRDGQSGLRVLKGFSLPDGTLLERNICRNTDGSVSVLDINNDGSKSDLHEQRMTAAEFIQYIKEQSKH